MTVCTPAPEEARESAGNQEALSTFVSDVSSAIRSTFLCFPWIVKSGLFWAYGIKSEKLQRGTKHHSV